VEAGTNGSGAGSKLLPTAPNKVGFIIHPNDVPTRTGEIGDFVWFDSDKDGTQNERFDGDGGQGAGINGIRVNLYDAADLNTIIRSSKTGYDHVDQKPGYYLFQGLPLDRQYVVEFVLPEKYMPTIMSTQNPNDRINIDSNF